MQSWDTANKAAQAKRFQRLHQLGKCQKHRPLSDGPYAPAHGIPGTKARGTCEQFELLRHQCRADRGQASGTQLIQELIADGLHAVTRYQPQADENHAHARADRDDRERFCLYPHKAPWLAYICTS